MTRYCITAIKTSSGEREIAFAKNARSTYRTEKEAVDQMEAVIKNNTPEIIY